jgi:FKBP-type peptidyl-prolyl cis-trans isomerase FkpA
MKSHVLLLVSLFAAASCNNEITGLEPPSDPSTETFAVSLAVNLSQMTRLDNGVYYRDLAIGTGAEVTDTAVSVNVTYAGFLKDGTLFSSGTNESFTLALVIPGLRSALFGMKVGGRRKVVIPSELGYAGHSQRGSDGKIIIPRQSTLVYDVEVLTVVHPEPAATP